MPLTFDRPITSEVLDTLGGDNAGLRVLFLIKALGAGPGGGAERILSLVSSALAARGHKILLLSFDPPGGADFYKLAPNVDRIRLGRPRASGRLSHPAALDGVQRIRRTARELRPDIAVGFMHSSFVPLAVALFGTGVPVVASERISYPHYKTRPFQRILLHASVPLIDLFTVNGEDVRVGYPRALASRMVVVPNPVAKADKLADPVGGQTRTLLSVGGLREQKDHQTLLLAFARLAGRFPGWRLKIVGDGPLRAELERRIGELGLSRSVEIAGATTQIEKEYAAAQLFVLPSRYEAFPNAVAEALSHGLPAVGFADCPGTSALIVPGVNGDLATGEDRARALAECLAPLMASAQIRKELASAAPSIVDRHSLGSIIDRWEQVLELARAGKSRAWQTSWKEWGRGINKRDPSIPERPVGA